MTAEPENHGLKIGWVCFHCWEFFPPTFAGQRDAQAHFGGSELREPACQISRKDHGLLLHVRALEMERDELRRQLNKDDTQKDRQIYGLISKHQTELRQAEEYGYAKGLRDGRAMQAAEQGSHCL